jgi:hypothetical protein
MRLTNKGIKIGASFTYPARFNFDDMNWCERKAIIKKLRELFFKTFYDDSQQTLFVYEEHKKRSLDEGENIVKSELLCRHWVAPKTRVNFFRSAHKRTIITVAGLASYTDNGLFRSTIDCFLLTVTNYL